MAVVTQAGIAWAAPGGIAEVQRFASRLTNYVTAVAASVAILFIAVNGIRWTMSSGNPARQAEAKNGLLVSLLYQAALAREARPAEQRPPVVAVIDEFQEFALTTFAKVVTATRKYGLGLVVANQNLSRVHAISPDVLETLLANVATLVTFRTAPGDAEVLAPFLAPFDADDLLTLAPHECYWRIPTQVGPRPVAARTAPLPTALRAGDDLDRLVARLRASTRARGQGDSNLRTENTRWAP